MSDEGATPNQDNLARGRTAMAFGTPISSYQWPDADTLNAGLPEKILAVEANDPGVNRSNVGGWYSQPDLLQWDIPEVATLHDRLRQYASDLTGLSLTGTDAQRRLQLSIDAWANVSRDGHYNSVHNHPMSHWSGVYYVAAGQPDPDAPQNGHLELLDPRHGITMMRFEDSTFESRYVIAPISGLMVFFPSWLNHFVHPFRGAGERISIWFNVVIRQQGQA